MINVISIITAPYSIFLLSLSCFFVVGLTGFYVLFKDSKSGVNRLFFLMCLTILLAFIGIVPFVFSEEIEGWNLREQGSFLVKVSWIGLSFMATFYLHTSLLLCKKETIFENKKFLFLFYLPPFFFLISPLIFNISFLGDGFSIEDIIMRMFNFTVFQAFLVYHPFYLLIATFFLTRRFLSLKSKTERTRILFFLVGSLFPVVSAFVALFSMGILKRYPAPVFFPYNFISMTLGMGIAAYGIIYKKIFIDYREILDIIFGSLEELVIVTDSEGFILLINDACLSKLNYKKEELIDEPLAKIIKGGGKKQKEVLERLIKEKRRPIQERIYFLTKQKDKIPFLSILSLKGDEIIYVGRDIRELVDYEKKLEKEIQDKTKELQEAKTTLEIKVKARTKELEELTQSLDQKVKERTKELEERINELESFHKLTIGRELKMVELKEMIKKLEEKLRAREKK